jgi:hypothetical protein
MPMCSRAATSPIPENVSWPESAIALRARLRCSSATATIQTASAVEEAFQISLDWCDGSPRRLQSAVRRSQQGAYELVIAATGFMNHSTDRALGPACKQAGVPYAHAYRGRTLACARAIATAVGLA